MNARTTPAAGGRTLRRMGDLLLTLLAIGGAVCIVLVILSWVFSISIMMFRTGSMSPTITTGSIAFVREIPAVEMEEGDVVTVGRGEGVLPVTHRVTEIRAQDPATGEVTFVMRGDANEAEDPEPYTATEVQRVMFAVPGAARVIQLFGDPRVLGALTVGATLLVVWAFWPRRDDVAGYPQDHHGDDPEDRDGDGPEDDPQHSDGQEGDGEVLEDPSPRDAPTMRALALPVLAALTLAAPAAGGPETTLFTGEHLRLQTTGDPAQMQNLAPGQSALWEVGIWADAPDPGEIRVGITGRGALAETEGALAVTVESCPTPWDGGECASGAERLLSDAPLDQLGTQAATHHLATFAAEDERWMRITVSLSESAASDVAGTSGDVMVEAVGEGEQLSTGDPPTPPEEDGTPPGEDGTAPGGDGTAPGGDSAASGGDDGGDLARTGATGALQMALAASTLLIAGAVLLRSRRLRSRRRR